MRGLPPRAGREHARTTHDAPCLVTAVRVCVRACLRRVRIPELRLDPCRGVAVLARRRAVRQGGRWARHARHAQEEGGEED
eukprot:7292796-Prymnesium_polylepis.1